MLIDDDDSDTFYHKIIIEEMNVTNCLLVAENGCEALRLLKEPDCIQPELIFLDLNMPKMNGWEFLDEYKNLNIPGKKSMIYILTTSMNPDDKERALQRAEVAGFFIKPLTKEILESIINNVPQ